MGEFRRAWLGVVALLLTHGCNSRPSRSWTGQQVCVVGIPAYGTGGDIVSATRPVEPLVFRSANEVRLRGFEIGPVAGFTCSGAGDLVARHTGVSGSTDLLEIDPFECIANDGRTYWLQGSGGSGLEALFLNQTMEVWLPDGPSLLICTTVLRWAPATDNPAMPDAAASLLTEGATAGRDQSR